MSLSSLRRRPHRVHAIAQSINGAPAVAGLSAECRTNARHVSRDMGEVNCRLCLYRLGRYMPLVKLREHQHAMGRGALLCVEAGWVEAFNTGCISAALAG